MDCFEDDAFGELVYEEEEEFAHELENRRNKDRNCTSTQEQQQTEEPADGILPELSDDDDEEDARLADGGKENGAQHQLAEQQMSRKRVGAVGVFNDYSPIDWHLRIGDEEQQAKRRRIALEEAVQRVTMRILDARRHQQQQRSHVTAANEPTTTMRGKELPTLHMQHKHKLLHLPPMDGRAWWGISSVDGTFRRYLGTRRHANDTAAAFATNALNTSAPIGNGDAAALAKLIEAEERVREREQQNQLHQQRNNQQSVRGDAANLVAVDGAAQKGRRDAAKFALWADKFAPTTFLDLLTEDETNRVVLLWLRLWDECVFGPRVGKTVGHPQLNGPHRNAKSLSLWDTLEERDRTLFAVERPKGTDCRMPKQKILALFGPSGVGKSSLARVAAVQAGYRPVIIPISELQNVAELKARLENATDSTSIDALFHNLSVSSSSAGPQVGTTRPCCFIVDAVEQASPEMVQFLCSWVRRSRPSAAVASVRRRPVICTCASLWNAPSLRELRANCLPVRVQRCNRERLQRRLEQICHCEGVQIGRDQLDELLLSHGSDIRLCLNTLQFSTLKKVVAANHSRNQPNKMGNNANFAFMCAADPKVPPGGGPSLPSPMNSAVTVSLFDTLSAIFTLDFHADNRGIVRPLPVRSRTLQMLFGQMSSDDFGRLQQLVFNNFATVLKLNMAQCRFVSALFTQLDALQTLLLRAQHFVLARYLPFSLALVHFHCALHVSRRLLFNLAVLPFAERQRENQQVMRSLRANVVTAQHYIGLADLLTWFAPLLWLVLQPPVKPSLWSDGGGGGQEQRQMIQRVVELMRTFRISFVRTTGADGMARFAFEPAFDSLVRFPAVQPSAIPSTDGNRIPAAAATTSTTTMHLISEPVKQYIAQQLEHAAPQKVMGGNRTPQQIGQHHQHNDAENNDRRHSGPQNWLSVDQRPVSPSSSSSSSATVQPLFTFRHSVGSSQAVRREIRIGTLFSA